MRSTICKRLWTFGLMCVLLLAMPLSAAASDDLTGHWAQREMAAAVEAGWITGYPDGTMRPDESITGAQAAVMLCRLLAVPAETDAGGSWYMPAAASAREMGFLPEAVELTAPLTRKEAFLMLASAFQTCGAQQSTESLDVFSDAAALTKAERAQIASLVDRGCVQGYNGALGLSLPVTRGQFAALLSRMLDDGKLLTGNKLSDWDGKELWIIGAGGSIRLDRVKAETVVLRCSNVSSLRLNGCEIGTLILAQQNGLNFAPRGVQCLRIGAGNGTVSITDNVPELEVTGARTVEMRGNAGVCEVSASDGKLTLYGRTDELTVTGENNTVVVNGTAVHTGIYGAGTVLEGRGSIRTVTLRAPGCTVSKRAGAVTDETDYGIYGAAAELTHPEERLPVGKTLKAAAQLTGAPAGLACTAQWIVDGAVVRSEQVTLTGEDSFALNYDYTYTRNMKLESTVEFVLRYTTAYGDEQTVSAQYVQQLENYSDDYFAARDAKRVLALVAPDYTGDYTLEWAENHDYTDFEKEIWVNAKGYESSSQYLIWINQRYQRVNIFQGSAGAWKLIHSCIVGCGAGSNTPQGVFQTTWNQPGWFTSTYDVRPVVRFYGGGYAFHSRLYYPGTDKLLDPGIGYPISHGCIRMYDEDVQWIYDNVPSGTTVVSY